MSTANRTRIMLTPAMGIIMRTRMTTDTTTIITARGAVAGTIIRPAD